jgi:hypothetical protein
MILKGGRRPKPSFQLLDITTSAGDAISENGVGRLGGDDLHR